MKTIDVVIADDHAVVRTGYRRLLELEEGVRVVAEFGDSDAAYAWLTQHSADVLILDLSMPGRGGMEVLQRLGARVPALRILVVQHARQRRHREPGHARGAAGYLTKSSAPEALVDAVRKVANGAGAVRRCRGPGRCRQPAAAAPGLVAARVRPVPPVRARHGDRGSGRAALSQHQDGGELPDADPQEDGPGQPGGNASLCGGARLRLSLCFKTGQVWPGRWWRVPRRDNHQ
ncbi:response regulator [Cupriavidus basilensis]